MTQEQVKALMESSTSTAQWNANAQRVKRECGGDYPEFWYPAIMQSGLAKRVLAKFGQTPDLKIPSGH